MNRKTEDEPSDQKTNMITYKNDISVKKDRSANNFKQPLY